MKQLYIFAIALTLAGASASPLLGQSLTDRFSVHGFFTQAYADASQHATVGVPTDGTGDYRSAALQLRFAASGNDQFIVQLSHRRVGVNALRQIEPDVSLDWGFYQRQLFGTNIRIGRQPMPKGLYNEIRDVSTILPFFRASRAFYTDGMETIDGASISRSFDVPGGFSLEASAYYGDLPLVISWQTQDGPIAIDAEGPGSWGGQLWVNLPITGVRAGYGILRTLIEGQGGAADLGIDQWYVSADATFERFFVRAEKISTAAAPSVMTGGSYAQIGVKLTEKLSVTGQYEHSAIELLAYSHKYDNRKDLAVGVSFAFTPQLVLKFEGHKFEGYDVDEAVNLFGAPVESNYFILSFATAF